ncbi:protein lin-54 homolog isoform X2 [Atheta coriaria]|uniref:protein lin-54 homolog isoform X2 n=1 Tax=Dalotia coriaria TaxID=877792 RepID=UPI0031F45B1D
MSFGGEDDHVDDSLTIDEATIDHNALASHLQIDVIDEAQEVDEQEGGDEVSDVITLEALSAGDADDVEIEMEMEEEKPKTVTIPPLRPLTIAPKPAKLPVSFKPVAGQQLLLLQGSGAGSQIKLINPGQGLTLSNLSISKSLTIKQPPKSTPAPSTISLVSPKKVVVKKVAPKSITRAYDPKTGQQIMVLQKTDANLKLLPTTSQPKTITFSEAQQLGIIRTKTTMASTAKQIVVSKGNQPKAIKIVPQLRSPTKILPAPKMAPTTTTNATSTTFTTKVQPSRIYLKQTNIAPSGAHIVPGQLIQVPSGQTTQFHPINIPGKGLQFIKFITSSQSIDDQTTTSPTSTVTKVTTTKLTPASPPPKQIIKVTKSLGAPVSKTFSSGSPVVMSRLSLSPTKQITTARNIQKNSSGDAVVPKIASPDLTMESNGIKTRKPCNCAKSQCLKLYCDCFANGEFCFMCNCMNCYNNIENEEQRQRAIKNCLERNPNAFRPKIGKGKDTGEATIRKHTKGCNCKRSGCLKNYCECYEAKIACSSNCKCMGCMNVESAPLTIAGSLEVATRNSMLTESNVSPQSAKKSPVDTKKKSISRQPSNYINGAVIEATSHCLVTIAKNAEETAQAEEATKKEIIEEFGRCLKQIIDCSLGKSSS